LRTKGVFKGVGVGPGDPGLITLKAIQAIDEAKVLILPSKDRESCRAYNIAAKAYKIFFENREDKNAGLEGKECLFEPFPMMQNKEALKLFHHEVAGRAAERLEEGKNVVFLTIGDPSVYSTFDYVSSILEDMGYETERIGGVTSFCAVADRLGISLAQKKEEIHIIPASADIDDALRLSGTKIFMKSGKQLSELKHKLKPYAEKKDCHIYGVTNCGLPDERIAYRLSDIEEDWGYLTVVIVKD